MKKNERKSENSPSHVDLVTVNGIAGETGIDRRTIQRHLLAGGAKPFKEDSNGRHYERHVAFGALRPYFDELKSKAAEPENLQPAKNLLRLFSTLGVRAAFDQIAGENAKYVFDMAQRCGVSANDAKRLAIEIWLAQAARTASFIIDDAFNHDLIEQSGTDLDEFWKQVGFFDQSKAPAYIDIEVPSSLSKWADELGELGRPLGPTLRIPSNRK